MIERRYRGSIQTMIYGWNMNRLVILYTTSSVTSNSAATGTSSRFECGFDKF